MTPPFPQTAIRDAGISALVVLCMAMTFSQHRLYAQADTDLYESEIRPLFIKHCQGCHGPDKQESDLRLDAPQFWEAGGISGPGIVPGKPEQSLVLLAVKKTDPDLAMPPGQKKLEVHEIAAIEKWIKQGAKAPLNPVVVKDERLDLEEAADFWSFQPITKPTAPTSTLISQWAWNDVDRFIRKRQDENGIEPVDLADKRTLIRRATFDLTGLPPTPEEIARFLADESPEAFDRVIDRLLNSEAYGERWARHWLDVARYADTAGDGADYPVREAYKYRDWVIQALNEDKPYDQFIKEQLAGDILAQVSPHEQYASLVTATGFLAVGKRYGYKPSPDYQHLDFADAIDSIGRSLLGLSLGCARCHDHKYDPVSAEDYYALYGIMQSTQWAFPGGEEQKRPSEFPALIRPDEVLKRNKEKEKRLVTIDTALADLRLEQRKLRPDLRAGGLDLGIEKQEIGKPLVAPWVCSGPIEVLEEAQSPFVNVHRPGTRGVRVGSGIKTDGIRYVFSPGLRVTSGKKMYFNIDFRARPKGKDSAFRLYLGQGVIQSIAVQFSVTTNEVLIWDGADWNSIRKLESDTWYSLQIAIDPDSKTVSGTIGTSEDVTSFEGVQLNPGWNGIADCFISDGFAHVDKAVMERDIDNVALVDTPLNPIGEKIKPKEGDDESVAQRLAELDKHIKELEQQRMVLAAEPAYEVAYGVSEGTPINVAVQLRGEPQNPGREVSRRFIDVLGGQPVAEGEGSGRKQLAGWIASSENPLTARVFVNRVWQWHFGQGIVSTPSDFGFRGAEPSHPELLDWLAAEFIENGWSVKALHKLIMKSRTYQLTSTGVEEGISKDPGNVLLWRYARRPLDAESMRDAMLAVSGLLKHGSSGEHPFPDVNTWGFTIHHPFHAVYDSSHRSIYLMQQRNRRHPYLELFDSADPNVSIGKRQQTVTPTQALYLMNSEFVHQQARGLAGRILYHSQSLDDRIRWAFEVTQGQVPEADDLKEARLFIESYLKQLSVDGTDGDEQAVWSAFSRVLLTSNKFLFVD